MAEFEKGTMYNNGNEAPKSTMGTQLQDFYFYRKALIDLVKEQFFMPLADTQAMPKNHGKKIKRYHYIPLLDDRNVNDQGIDATGAVIANGNLYGSSRDIGNVTKKLPLLREEGGRVNRVGYSRKTIEGTFTKMGFFDEFTDESMAFDSDSDLEQHMARESLRAAHEITEATLQIDLLNGAGVVKYAGEATKEVEITGEGATVSEVSYADLVRLSIDLDNNKTPKSTTVITGSRMIDTRVVGSARYLFISSALLPTLMQMKDYHGGKAFISVEHYADAGTIRHGEAGSIAGFRVVVVPEMLHWAATGAEVTADDGNGYRFSENDAGEKRFDIYPMLVVGDGSFTTIGFQTAGKTVKFDIITKKPGREMADRHDPYGEMGFHSIKWYYGCMILRNERLAVIKTVAPL